MSQPELLKRVVGTLNRAGVPYMVVGSVVSSLQGEPRSTHDIDIVVEISQAAGQQLVATFCPPDYYLDAATVRDAIRDGEMFNLLDSAGGDKVDFWVLGDDPYKRRAFERRVVANVLGIQLSVQAPEDTILSKLHWSKLMGGSEKQLTDALRVYELQFGRLDLQYIDQWAQRIGVVEDWQRIKAEADVEDV